MLIFTIERDVLEAVRSLSAIPFMDLFCDYRSQYGGFFLPIPTFSIQAGQDLLMNTSLSGHADPSLLTANCWIRGILDAIEACGLDSGAIAGEAGLDCALLADPDLALSDEYGHKLLRLASERADDATFGLCAAQHCKPSAFGALGYAMMASPDLRGALERASRLSASLTQAISARLVTTEKGLKFDILARPYSFATTRHAQEYMVLAFMFFLRWMTGRELTPLQVTLMPTAPLSASKYTACFGTMPEFNAPMASLSFSHEQLGWPLMTSNPGMSGLLDQHALKQALHIGQPNVLQQTRHAVSLCLHEGDPTLEKIAVRLNIGARTLQRRLEVCGTTFHELVDDVRRDQLKLFLYDRDMPLKLMAARLGFADQSSFTRATNRWFGLPPGKLRRHRESEPSPT